MRVYEPTPPIVITCHVSFRRWIIYDGDVDAVWVEDMNSVMDDNRTLTLPNGERIRLQPHAIMLFEVSDLQYASPATVSRCGMVFVDPKDLGHRPFVDAWLSERPPRFTELFDSYAEPALDFVLNGIVNGSRGAKPKLPLWTSKLNLSRSFTALVDALLPLNDDGDRKGGACAI